MKNKIVLILFIIFASMLIIPLICTAEQISEQTVLIVDTCEFTEYELEKRMDKSLPSDSLKSYIDSFIDRAYLLAHAANCGYMEDPEIEQSVEIMAKTIVTQPLSGLIYEEVINKNIYITDQELKETYLKFNILFSVEYLRFPDYTVFKEIVENDSLMTDEETFAAYVRKCEMIPEVQYDEKILSWPFMNFVLHQDYLYSMKENQITSPIITHRGVFILHITHIENRKNILPFEEKKEMLLRMTTNEKQLEGMYQYDNKLLATARINIYESTAENIFTRLDYSENSYLIDKEAFKDISNELLISFSLDGKLIEITVENFIDYNNGQIVIRRLDNRIELYNLLKDWVIIECGYLEAEKLGVTKTKKFILDKKNYKYDHILNMYVKNELQNNITVLDSEIEQAYHNRNDSFGDGTHVNLSVLWFDSMGNAMQEYMKLDLLLAKDMLYEIDVPDSAKGYIGKELGVTVSHDSNEYSLELMQALLRADDNVLMRPVEMKGNFAIIYKHFESGSRVKPLNEVRTELAKELSLQKLEIMKKELVDKLKKKFTIENNIDYDKYLN